jgi:hypothetical protein
MVGDSPWSNVFMVWSQGTSVTRILMRVLRAPTRAGAPKSRIKMWATLLIRLVIPASR